MVNDGTELILFNVKACLSQMIVVGQVLEKISVTNFGYNSSPQNLKKTSFYMFRGFQCDFVNFLRAKKVKVGNAFLELGDSIVTLEYTAVLNT